MLKPLIWKTEFQIQTKWKTLPSTLAPIVESHHLHLHLITFEDEMLTIHQAALWTTVLQNVFDMRWSLKAENWRKTQGRHWKVSKAFQPMNRTSRAHRKGMGQITAPPVASFLPLVSWICVPKRKGAQQPYALRFLNFLLKSGLHL